MHLKNARDFWAGTLFAGAGLAALWQAVDSGLGRLDAPGPGLVPAGLGAALTLLGVLLWLKALTVEADRGAPVGRLPWRALAAMALAVGGGALLTHAVGAAVGVVAAGVAAAVGWRGLGGRAALTAGLVGALTAGLVGSAVAMPVWGGLAGAHLSWWPWASA